MYVAGDTVLNLHFCALVKMLLALLGDATVTTESTAEFLIWTPCPGDQAGD